jgi:hypothetical protein
MRSHPKQEPNERTLTEDEILRRMLNTPPKPKAKPPAPAKAPQKKTGQ